MFTGLVEGMGILRENRAISGGRGLCIDLAACAEGVRTGDSICVSGVCLTVAALSGQLATFELSPETLARSGLGDFEIGHKVNLERSLRLGDRLGGHFLTGHVDGLGSLRSIQPEGGFSTFHIQVPAALRPLLVDKGSIGVDGVSLTVASLEPEGCSLALIPETLRRTTLGAARPGSALRIEADLLAKHVARLLQCAGQLRPA